MTTAFTEINPWSQIWLRPRAAIKAVVTANPRYMMLTFVTVWGVFPTIQLARILDLNSRFALAEIVFLIAFFGPLVGLFWMLIWGAMFRWTGIWLGGRATWQDSFAALAWTRLPTLLALPLHLLLLVLVGEGLFTPDRIEFVLYPGIAWGVWGITGALTLYGWFLAMKCFAEVQGFSAWRGLLSLLMGAYIVSYWIGGASLILTSLGIFRFSA